MHVLGQPIGPIFKCQEIQEEDFLTLEDWYLQVVLKHLVRKYHYAA